jgi:hypothetical protein
MVRPTVGPVDAPAPGALARVFARAVLARRALVRAQDAQQSRRRAAVAVAAVPAAAACAAPAACAAAASPLARRPRRVNARAGSLGPRGR